MTRKDTFYMCSDSTQTSYAYVTLYKDALNEWYYSQYNSSTQERVSITRLSAACPDAEKWVRNAKANAKHVKDHYVNVVGNLC